MSSPCSLPPSATPGPIAPLPFILGVPAGRPRRQAPQAPEALDVGTTQDPGSVAVHGSPRSCTGHGQSQLQERAQLRPRVVLCGPLKTAPKDTHAPTPGTWMSLI